VTDGGKIFRRKQARYGHLHFRHSTGQGSLE
jgi:hypothetical protein